MDAGFCVTNPTCGACLGMSNGVLANGESCASTTNRNFNGRMGKGGMVHLMSPATAAATAITMVFLGALLTCLHLYEKLAKYAGAGTIVPITGFANAIVSPAMEFKSEGLILGLGAKLFVIAGPVLVYGISASVIYGLILFLTGGGSV